MSARKKLWYGRPPWIRHTLSRPGPRFVSRGSCFGVLSSPWYYLQKLSRFSLLDETFTVHPNPPCSDYLGGNDSLSALGGKLCYIHSTSPWDISIWLVTMPPSLPADTKNASCLCLRVD
uniref:Uncharacterized protein n=1 Tax=Triticum urartu TaxID=4572 RepID=A0A8R7VD29_TRIUA